MKHWNLKYNMISYNEMSKNNTLNAYVEPLEIERAATKDKLRQYYLKRMSELKAATDDDSKTLLEFYRRLFIKFDGVKNVK